MSQGRAYRRGTVAGLSLGEIFILLSFVLMVAVLLISEEARREGPLGHVGVVHAKSDRMPDPETVKALSEEAEHTRAELEQALAREERLKSGYEELAEALARERARRHQAEADADEAVGQAEAGASAQEELAEEIAAHGETKAALAQAEVDAASGQEELAKETAAHAETKTALAEALEAVEAMEEVQAKEAEAHAGEQTVVQDYIEQLKGTVEALTGEAEAARKGEEEAQAALEAAMRETVATREAAGKALVAEREARQAAQAKVAALERAMERRESADLHADKGVDPPCWYVRVATANGGDREKALYAIDVAIHDDHIVLGRRSPPPGGPDQGESGSYRAEYDALGLGELPYGQRLENTEVRKALGPIRDAGNSARVRSYPCKFYAQVWDRTGTASKSRWQEAHANVIQQYLNTYVVQDTPWRH